MCFNISNHFDYIFNILDEYDNGRITNIILLEKVIHVCTAFVSVKELPSNDDTQGIKRITNYYETLMNVFNYYIRNTNSTKILVDCFHGLFFLTYLRDAKFLYGFFDKDIINTIITLYYANISTKAIKNSYIEPILRIIGNLSDISEDFGYKLCTENVINFIKDTLLDKSFLYSVKRQIIWVIKNLCIDTHLDILFKYDLYYGALLICLSDFQNISDKIRCELFSLFCSCFAESDISVNLINDTFVMTLIKQIQSIDDNDIKYKCVALVVTENVLKYKSNEYKHLFINNGIQDIFEKWAITSNEVLRNESEALIKKYFDNNEY